LGLTFVHLPVPHAPYVYDRQKGTWDTTTERQYFDNVALADRALGELRQTMEQAGTWDQTTVIISSDHWWRIDYWRSKKNLWAEVDDLNEADHVDYRVPFIVKLPGQTTQLTYEPAFNTVLTHDLVLDVLRGKVTKAADVSAWLDAHRTIGESPYHSYED